MVQVGPQVAPPGLQVGGQGGSWGQVGLQNRPKINQKSDHILDTFSDRFLIAFWKLLGRILVDFWSQVEGQVDQKFDHIASSWQVRRNIKKAKKNNLFFNVFWSLGLPTSTQN